MQNFLKDFIIMKQLLLLIPGIKLKPDSKEEQEQYPGKLYDLEITPPAQTWNKILTLLDEENSFPEIPSKRRIISFVRYAAAAACILASCIGAFKLLNQKKMDHAVTA